MSYIPGFLERIQAWAPAAVVLVLLLLAHFIVSRRAAEPRQLGFGRQVAFVAAWALGALVVILLLPVKDAIKGQLLSVLGLLISAAVALSSTTVLGNAMAGLMLRFVRNFRNGDFVRCGEHFGRVTERDLFHVELQDEERNLITLPNMYLVTHPVTVVNPTGTLVTADVSLGYDVSHDLATDALVRAAQETKLEEPFVRVVELGDYSVSYRVVGLLQDVKHLLTTRTQLHRNVLATLHREGIEIASPALLTTRVLGAEQRIVPPEVFRAAGSEGGQAEKLMFDKADRAEALDNLRDIAAWLHNAIKAAEDGLARTKELPEREQLQTQLESLQTKRDWLAEKIRHAEESKQD